MANLEAGAPVFARLPGRLGHVMGFVGTDGAGENIYSVRLDDDGATFNAGESSLDQVPVGPVAAAAEEATEPAAAEPEVPAEPAQESETSSDDAASESATATEGEATSDAATTTEAGE